MLNLEMAAPRILITYPFPLGRATGGARMTREIARHLGRAGARVTILPVSANVARGAFPRRPVQREFLGLEFDEELAADSVDIVRVAQSPLHWIRDASRVRSAVEAIAGRGRVDAVLSYYMEGAFLPDALARRRIPFGYISTWQSYAKAIEAPLRAVPRALWQRATRRLAVEPHRRADVLFATSRFTSDELVEIFGVRRERVRICPLGVDPAFFDVPRQPRPEVRRLLFFGRIIPSKGVLDAIRALGRLAETGEGDFVLRLVGQGDHDWARAAAVEHGIGDRVELRGPAGDDELREELSRADLALLPSHFEAFGLAFAEAQAAGLAVVAYRAGSVPEVVEDGVTGWLAPLHDVEGLAERLGAALRDPQETARRGAAARDRVRRLFTWERTAATILDGLGFGRGAPSLPTPAEGTRSPTR